MSSVDPLPSTMALLVGRVTVWLRGAMTARGGVLMRVAGSTVTLAAVSPYPTGAEEVTITRHWYTPSTSPVRVRVAVLASLSTALSPSAGIPMFFHSYL